MRFFGRLYEAIGFNPEVKIEPSLGQPRLLRRDKGIIILRVPSMVRASFVKGAGDASAERSRLLGPSTRPSRYAMRLAAIVLFAGAALYPKGAAQAVEGEVFVFTAAMNF